MMLKGGEPIVPLVGEGSEELLSKLNGCGAQPVKDTATLAWCRCHQPRADHEGEVLGDRLTGDRQARREVGDSGGAIAGKRQARAMATPASDTTPR
ncbi:MAG TPA: hypothetical protein VKY15_00980, partial [Acidimicrobiales bacterium]|nr:hypothetical protein [Acidimicrobiales bacterium]